MTVDADVANQSADQAPDGHAEQPEAESAEPDASTPRRARSMPKFPINRAQADAAGRVAFTAVTATAGFVANCARWVARAAANTWQATQAVPAALRLFVAAGVLMLLGVVGGIALHSTLGLLCIVVVIPLCASTLGVLGYRWYSADSVHTPPMAVQPAPTDLQRSVEYVDKKLAQALSSFGTEHHQQAVVALFQAKTAVELALGTEQDTASCPDIFFGAVDNTRRPRIRAGVGPTSLLPESNSLAAS